MKNAVTMAENRPISSIFQYGADRLQVNNTYEDEGSVQSSLPPLDSWLHDFVVRIFERSPRKWAAAVQLGDGLINEILQRQRKLSWMREYI
jgi:hypothetical protein